MMPRTSQILGPFRDADWLVADRHADFPRKIILD